MIKCKQCIEEKGKSKNYKKIGWKHLKYKHNMTIKNYKQKFGGPLVCKETKKKISENSGWTKKKAIKKYGKKEGIKRWNSWKKKISNNKENFIKKYGKERGLKKWNEYKRKVGWSKKKAIKKYGKKEGLKKWNEYCKKQAYTNSFEYKKEKYGWTKEQFDEYNQLRSQTKENMIKRYGKKEGLKKWNEYCERQSYAGNKREYFIEKYGKHEGEIIYNELSLKKGQSLKSYIFRNNNNVELSKIKRKEFFKKVLGGTSSNIANELFNSIMEFEEMKKFNEIYYDDLNQEWFFSVKNTGIFQVDFFCKDNGKIIEFNGEYWHADPRIYNENDLIKYPGNNIMFAKKVWEKDKNKLDIIKKVPYINDIKVIWENDYENNKEKIIKECVEYLCKK